MKVSPDSVVSSLRHSAVVEGDVVDVDQTSFKETSSREVGSNFNGLGLSDKVPFKRQMNKIKTSLNSPTHFFFKMAPLKFKLLKKT